MQYLNIIHNNQCSYLIISHKEILLYFVLCHPFSSNQSFLGLVLEKQIPRVCVLSMKLEKVKCRPHWQLIILCASWLVNFLPFFKNPLSLFSILLPISLSLSLSLSRLSEHKLRIQSITHKVTHKNKVQKRTVTITDTTARLPNLTINPFQWNLKLAEVSVSSAWLYHTSKTWLLHVLRLVRIVSCSLRVTTRAWGNSGEWDKKKTLDLSRKNSHAPKTAHTERHPLCQEVVTCHG